ncbi:MAG: chorismate synthase [Dehalococcoidia bacterium]|nr:MAG: chorismate synthase [Dehalococcoidia bacterium]
MLRFLTAGESHGPACVVIIEGIPAGLGISAGDINRDLARRRSDYGRGGRGLLEKDECEILAGARYGRTLGSPIALVVQNRDFENWQAVMRIEASDDEAEPLTRPRPGHADLAAALKYGQGDIRNVLERASARETVSRVMAGAVCRRLLGEFGIRVASHTVQIGKVKLEDTRPSFEEVAAVYERDPETRCLDPEVSRKMKTAIDEARRKGDTLGGVLEVIARGVPVGLGSVMHYDRRLDGALAGALASIPSVKAVEIGDGCALAGLTGSQTVDAITPGKAGFSRRTNHMGGIEGGISNGEDIVLRVYHKPIATLGKPARTVDLATGKSAEAITERSDICIVPRAGVVSEAMTCFVLAQALLEKFGGDNLAETRRNCKNYLKRLATKKH